MNGIIAFIEKGRPFFDKLSSNIYLQSIRDGFLNAMPAILFSSIFILCAALPEVFGFALPAAVSSWLWRVYNLSMGIVGILVAATTARSLAEGISRKLPAGVTINTVSCMLASVTGFLMLAVTEIDGGIDVTYLGTKGLLCSFIAAFITVNMYRFCAIKNITIKMPPEVPGVISNVFKNVFPYSFSAMACVLIDLVCTQLFGVRFAESIILLFSPFFSAADSYIGLAIIAGAMAFFWFLGIHGPSIVEPAVAAAIYANVEINLMAVQNGQHAGLALTTGFQNFIACFGGTGATLVVPFLFMWACRSKQLKAVGKASFLPVIFGVNEPVLFAAPMVLNPYFFVPFMLAPMANAVVFKLFIDLFNTNSFIYVMPWATPAPLGMFLGMGMSVMALVLAAALIALDVVIYMPFVKAYDKTLVEEESKNKDEEAEEKIEAKSGEMILLSDSEMPAQSVTPLTAAVMAPASDPVLNSYEVSPFNVLVLCVGAGTSAMFANAVNKGAQAKNLPVHAEAEAFGGHTGILSNFQLVVLSPQVQSRYDEIKADADALGIKVVKTRGAQYINMTKDPEGAVDFVVGEYSGFTADHKDAKPNEKKTTDEKPEMPKTVQVSSMTSDTSNPLNVLVLCVGAGTSAMFANAVNKGAQAKNLPVHAEAEAFGGHTGILNKFQLVVLSPQVQARYEEIKADADALGIKVVKTKGAQYINLTRDPEGAVDFVVNASNE